MSVAGEKLVVGTAGRKVQRRKDSMPDSKTKPRNNYHRELY